MTLLTVKDVANILKGVDYGHQRIYLEKAVAECRERLKAIEEVWEKYKNRHPKAAREGKE